MSHSRIRFKRRIEHRAEDAQREIDPSRTQLGISSDRLGLSLALGIMMLAAALAGLIAFMVLS